MSGGLFALLDDIAVLARASAASLDDVAAAALKASTKAVGVVVDDTAVTPTYVTGLDPARELPIIWKIALGSLRNKLIIILPILLLLSGLWPIGVTYLLLAGGLFLCFEGAEKVYEAVTPGDHTEAAAKKREVLPPAEHEKQIVSSAVRTDLILSGEIMAISLADVASEPLLQRALILIVVGLLLTALVYGVVALIVKMDDVGVRLVASERAGTAALGRRLVTGMPKVLNAFSVIGTAAMLWVGGHIVLSNLAELGWPQIAHSVHALEHAAGAALPPFASAAEWLAGTAASGVFGLLVGLVVFGLVQLLHRRATH